MGGEVGLKRTRSESAEPEELSTARELCSEFSATWELFTAGSYRLALEDPHISSPQGLARSSAR